MVSSLEPLITAHSQSSESDIATGQTAAGRRQSKARQFVEIVGESGNWLNALASSANRSKKVVPFLAITAAAFGVALARSTHPSQRFSFWGEDGNVFTMQARSHGVAHSLITTYAGYFELLPRLFAALVSGLPLEWTPPLYATLAMAVSAGIAGISFVAGRDGLNLPIWAALILSGTVLLLPASGPETFASLTNLEWYCEAGAIVFLAAWWNGWRTPPFATGFLLFLAFATSPVSLVVLPVVVLRTWTRRGRLDFVVLASTALASLYQGIGHLAARPVPTPGGGLDVGKLISIYAVRVVDDTVAGFDLSYTAWRALTPAGSVVVGLGLLALVVASIGMTKSPRSRGTALVLVVLSFALFILAGLERDLSSMGNVGFAPYNGTAIPLGGRYMGTPSLCLVLAVLVLFAPRPSDLRGRDVKEPLRRLGLAIFSGILGVFLLYNVPLDLGRFPLSNWERQVRAAHTYCRANHDRGHVSIINAPGGQWVLRITCQQAFG